MADSDKNILIIPNIGSTDDPVIAFTGASNSLSATVYSENHGTISFDGSSGQLFSITNELTGTIFSVNDISGIPSIEVEDDGTVRLAQFDGNVGIGVEIPNEKLTVSGNVSATGFATLSTIILTDVPSASAGLPSGSIYRDADYLLRIVP